MQNKLQFKWSPLYLVILLVLGWITYITINISLTPPDGSETPNALTSDLAESIQTHDVDRLSRLLDYPPRDRHDFADQYLSELDSGSTPVTVTPKGDDLVEFSGTSNTGQLYRYTMRITQDDHQQWLLTFLPPIPADQGS